MQALRPAVDEHERLLADLRALEGELDSPGEPNSAVEPLVCRDCSTQSEEPVPVGVLVGKAVSVGTVASGVVAPSPSRAREPVHTRPLVSPKVMRLMG